MQGLAQGWTHSYNLNALGGQGLGSGLGDIASDAADLELAGQGGVVEDGPDDGAALVAGGAKYGDEFRHVVFVWR